MRNVRTLETADYAAWRRLWNGYCAFYHTDVPEDATAQAWAAAMDPATSIVGRVACAEAGAIIGFSLSIVHPTTWRVEPSCYLEDLFVDPIIAAEVSGAH